MLINLGPNSKKIGVLTSPSPPPNIRISTSIWSIVCPTFLESQKIVSYVNACTNEVGTPQKNILEFQTTYPLPPLKWYISNFNVCVTQIFFQWKSIDTPYKKAQGLQKSPNLIEKAPKAKKSHNKCRASFTYELKCTQSIRYQSNVVDPCPPYRGAHPLQKNSLLFCPPQFYF